MNPLVGVVMDEKITVTSKPRSSRRPSAVVISRKKWLLVRVLAMVTGVLVLLLSAALATVLVLRNIPPYCPGGLSATGRNLDKPGLFNDLTPGEMEAVRNYMLSQKRLGLVPFEKATVNSSYIFMMTLQVPLKAAVLQFQEGLERKPHRAAKVIVYRGDADTPRVDEYVVGSLPNPKYYRAVTSPAYRRSPIPFTSRPVDAVERKCLQDFLSRVTEELHPLFMESYGLMFHNCTRGGNCILFQDFAPRGTESGERKTWFWAYRDTEGFHLHPLGFAVQIDHQSPFVTEWSVSRVIYNGQLFYEIEDLVERYAEGSLRKIQQIMDSIDAQFSSFSKRGHQSFDTPLRAPRLIEPDGHRYSIDDQHVQYFGWSFNFHMHTVTGLQILDAYFQGEKVAYEISLQDIVTFYTGYSPETAWLGMYGVSSLLGASSYELVPGVDCPATSTFRDSYHFVNSGKPQRYRNSICIFEHTASTPLRRRSSRGPKHEFHSYGGLVSSYLVLRTIISLWSCDYILDYIFHLDGTVELKISLTGYVQASFDLPGQRPYGNRIHDYARGNLHQHLFHWKIDLDIEKTTNRYQTLDITTESESSFWYEGAVNKTQLRFDPVLKEDEREASVPYDFEVPQQHVIFNMKAGNRYETYRGYRIINEARTKFLLENSAVTRAAGWAKYQMAVTKYKDVEDASSSIYAQGDPYNPVLDFSRYLEDNDTIVDTDLVVWVTSGLYHLPHTEDVPSISTTGHQCRLLLRPYNFFNHCPSMAVSDALMIRHQHASASNSEHTTNQDSNPDNDKSHSRDLLFETFNTDSSEPQCYQKEKSIRDFHGDITYV